MSYSVFRIGKILDTKYEIRNTVAMWFFKICAMIIAVLMIKYRERMGDLLGEAEWMRYVGGVYNLVIIIAVFIFFWAVASLTGTQQIFFAPLYWLVGGAFQG